MSDSAAAAPPIEAPPAETIVSTDILDRKWIDVNIPCKAACPVMTDIPEYIQAIMDGDYKTAYQINRRDNILPHSLGRVCNRPCEPACRHGREGLGEPVAICYLKRAAADFGYSAADVEKDPPRGQKVCIIGAGPSGLTAANDLAIKGYEVKLLEQFEAPGGMLRYGIPAFRLPYDLVAQDVQSIVDLGVELECNARIESAEQLEALKTEYDAVLMAGGCMLPKAMDLPGMDAQGFFWGLNFMMEANRELLTELDIHNVVVIGGGFTAVDCVRTAYRLGAANVTLAYRRTKDRMSAGDPEIECMEEEGIEMQFLVSPEEILTRDGKVVGIRLIRNRLVDGRPQPIEGSGFDRACEGVIMAIGQDTEDLPGTGLEAADGIHQDGNFFLAGDFRNGSGTVIEACADGRKVARQAHQFLAGIKGYRDEVHIEPVDHTTLPRTREDDFIPLTRMPHIPLSERLDKNREVETGFSNEDAEEEARRCYLCHYNFQIDIDRCIYCMACIDVMPVDCIKLAKDIQIDEDGGIHYEEAANWDETEAITIDNDKCIRCGNCVRACPVDCIPVSKYTLKTVEVT
jgi:glutamate synthase (NADPH) small chain